MLLSDPLLTPETIQLAWKTGRLKYKLQPRQKQAYDLVKNAPPREIFPLVCTRGFGKTFIGSVLANEEARKQTDSNVLIISSTLKKLRTIVKPAFDTILSDCPAEYRPKYNSQDSFYDYDLTKMRTHLCAAEKGRIEDVRGIHKVSLVLIDEAAFFGDDDDSYPLDYVIESILNPMFLRTKSIPRIIMMSTPPEIPNHPFDRYCEIAEVKGFSSIFDIYKSDIEPEKIEDAKQRCNSKDAWDREFLCKKVRDINRVIIPEWNEKYVQATERTDKFKFWDKYFSVDTGSIDKTVGLLGYYDFEKASLFIEDEIVYQGRDWTTKDLADELRSKEETQWGKGAKVYRRIGDNDNQILLSDLSITHQLPIIPTDKNSLQAMVNKVRLWANSGRILVNPRCKLLIQTLKGGIWDKKKNEFGRSPVLGHMDAIAALVYLVRNIDERHNPVPKDYGYDPATQYWDGEKSKSPAVFEKVFVEGNPFVNGLKNGD